MKCTASSSTSSSSGKRENWKRVYKHGAHTGREVMLVVRKTGSEGTALQEKLSRQPHIRSLLTKKNSSEVPEKRKISLKLTTHFYFQAFSRSNKEDASSRSRGSTFAAPGWQPTTPSNTRTSPAPPPSPSHGGTTKLFRAARGKPPLRHPKEGRGERQHRKSPRRPLLPGRARRLPRRPPAGPLRRPEGRGCGSPTAPPPAAPAAPSATAPSHRAAAAAPPAPHLRADVGHEGRLGRLGPAAQHGSGRLPSAPGARSGPGRRRHHFPELLRQGPAAGGGRRRQRGRQRYPEHATNPAHARGPPAAPGRPFLGNRLPASPPPLGMPDVSHGRARLPLAERRRAWRRRGTGAERGGRPRRGRPRAPGGAAPLAGAGAGARWPRQGRCGAPRVGRCGSPRGCEPGDEHRPRFSTWYLRRAAAAAVRFPPPRERSCACPERVLRRSSPGAMRGWSSVGSRWMFPFQGNRVVFTSLGRLPSLTCASAKLSLCPPGPSHRSLLSCEMPNSNPRTLLRELGVTQNLNKALRCWVLLRWGAREMPWNEPPDPQNPDSRYTARSPLLHRCLLKRYSRGLPGVLPVDTVESELGLPGISVTFKRVTFTQVQNNTGALNCLWQCSGTTQQPKWWTVTRGTISIQGRLS